MLKKKLMSLGIAAILAVSSFTAPVFADNTDSSMTKTERKALYQQRDHAKKDKDDDEEHRGRGNGKGKGHENKNSSISNVSALKMIIEMLGLDDEAEKITITHPSYNGKKLIWGHGYIYMALEKGIITPDETYGFNANSAFKRYQAAKYIVRAIGMDSLAKQNMNVELDFDDDNSIPDDAIGYVYVATKLELMEENDDDEFQPMKAVSKREMERIIEKAGKVGVPGNNDNANIATSTFVSVSNNKSIITVKNGTSSTNTDYALNPNAPVYMNNGYTTVDSLKAGDTIKLVFSRTSQVIFIEVISTAIAEQKLTVSSVNYNDLSDQLKTQVDTLKLTNSYRAFKQGNYIYLLVTMGQKNTGGYAIAVKDVYKVQLIDGKYDIKVVVDQVYPPANSFNTQVVNYPYNIVRIDSFSGIQNIKFVDTSSTSIAQTVLTELDTVETISGTISSIDAANRKLYVTSASSTTTEYTIPSEAVIKLNNISTQLSSLTANMYVVITKNNGVITLVSAIDATTAVTGTISQVDAANRKLKVTESNGVTTEYSIPADAVIKLNNAVSQLSALVANMNVVLTKTNGIIIQVSATDNIAEVSGTLLAVTDINGKLLIVKSGNEYKNYLVDASTVFIVNNQVSTLENIPLNSTIVLKLVNGVLKEVKML
ncbi:MAG: protease complex subunit PrcB family protein [Bacillota bacterium]